MSSILAQLGGIVLATEDVVIEGEPGAGTVVGVIAVAGFAVLLFLLNRWLRRRERQGDFDAGSSSATRPGLRVFFDYGPNGFGRDGSRQEPPDR